MNLVDETADLVNRLASIVDDSTTEEKHGGIMRIEIDESIARVLMSENLFLQSFPQRIYDVGFRNVSNRYPYELKSELDGVRFIAIMGAKDVLALKDTHPDHFEYISRTLQL